MRAKVKEIDDLPGFDINAIVVDITRHSLELAEARAKRTKGSGSDGRVTSEIHTVRVPMGLCDEMRAVMKELKCSRNFAFNFILRRGVKAILDEQKPLAIPRDLIIDHRKDSDRHLRHDLVTPPSLREMEFADRAEAVKPPAQPVRERTTSRLFAL